MRVRRDTELATAAVRESLRRFVDMMLGCFRNVGKGVCVRLNEAFDCFELLPLCHSPKLSIVARSCCLTVKFEVLADFFLIDLIDRLEEHA
jgi:hypothetical protein